jgi:galactonate dehydratase
MNRRSFLHTALAGAGATLVRPRLAQAALPKAKITRIRYYKTPTDAAGRPNTQQPLFNQSTHVVVVETDAGLVGIGEGGSHDTMQQSAGMLIGENPFQIERLWQTMTRSYFYPAGRERLHAIGALDMALWDIKGKALGVPLYDLLGGLTREYVDCYATSFPRQGDERETARACVEFGYRVYRMGVTGAKIFDRFEEVQRTYEACKAAREGAGKDGAWAVDYHTRLDPVDAVRLSTMIEPLRPYFVEDLIRTENPDIYRTLRAQLKVPIATGEEYGNRWDISELVENDLIDYARVTVPNTGGITEFMKIANMCETHFVGLIPHFTGPISEAAMVHLCGIFPGTALMEMLGRGDRSWPYVLQGFDFRKGRMYPVPRPGLGVEVDTKQLELILEVNERYAPMPMNNRPDGTPTNW